MYKGTKDLIKDHFFDDVSEMDNIGISLEVRRRILRIRAIYEYHIAFPSKKNAQLIKELEGRFHIKKTQAYQDLAIIRELIGNFNHISKDYERWKINEQLDEAYTLAKSRRDPKVMVMASRERIKNNATNVEDTIEIPYDEIIPQPFIPTDNPEVLGLKRIPNIQKRIADMKKQFSAELVQDIKPDMADVKRDVIMDTPTKLEQLDE